MSSAAGLKTCTKAAGIKKHRSIIRKYKKKHDKTVFLAKTNLKNMKVLISKALTDRYIIYGQLVLVNNVLKEYNEMKEEIKDLKTSSVH